MPCDPLDYRSKSNHSEKHEDTPNFVKSLFESQEPYEIENVDWEKAWRKKQDWNAYRDEMGFRSRKV